MEKSNANWGGYEITLKSDSTLKLKTVEGIRTPFYGIYFDGENFLDKGKVIQLTKESKEILREWKKRNSKDLVSNATWEGFLVKFKMKKSPIFQSIKGVKGKSEANFDGENFLALPERYKIELTQESERLLKIWIKENPSIEDEIKSVSSALQIAKQFTLESEVVLFALLAVKNNPNISINEALSLGLEEWDCL